jgi:uncharacterized Zn-binding protein involved in type VI secretion
MASVVRVGDTTNHGGTVTGPGEATVLVGGMPAAVLGDMHVCSLPPNAHQPTASPFIASNATVLVGGKPIVTTSDSCGCGAMAVIGSPTVTVG